jgi:uncharacterized phage protein (TIGR02220 family)
MDCQATEIKPMTASFALAPLALATDSRLTLTDTRLLLGLLSFAKPDTLTCWPSRKTLAERLGISSVSRISETIARLESLGWLEVTRRLGSSLYRITPPLHPGVEPPPPPRSGQPEQTTEQTNHSPLPPQAGDGASSANEVPSPLTLDHADEPPVAAETVAVMEAVAAVVTEQAQTEACQQRQADEPSVTTEAVKVAEAVVTSSVTEEAQPEARQERHEAAVRVITHLNKTTGQHLPTDGATARLVRRRLVRYSEQDLTAVVDMKRRQWKETELERHLTPRTLFRPTALEGYISEVRQAQEQRQKHLQTLKSAIPAPPVNATKEGAARGIAALKAALGMRDKPADGCLSA